MRKLIEFVREFYSHWQAAWLGTVSILLAIWLWATGSKDLTWGAFAAAAFVCFLCAAYQLWNEKREELKKIEKGHVAPRLYLRYEDSYAIGDQTGFFIGVEGEQKAFRVTIKSEEAVSVGHKRIGILWEVPAGMIGTTAIPVAAICVEYKGNVPYPRGGLKEGQVGHFFDYKNGVEELIVTVKFLDVHGKEWSKRFKVYRERLNTLEKRIVCHPLPQAAS